MYLLAIACTLYLNSRNLIFFSTLQILVIDRYNSTTGTFTVPPGGDGHYYFSAYFLVSNTEFALFDIQINAEVLCTARGDERDATNEAAQAACSAATYATEGLYLLKIANNHIGK